MLGKLDLFKENDIRYMSFTKIIKKWVKDLNVRLETWTTGEILPRYRHRQGLFERIDEWNFLTLKSKGKKTVKRQLKNGKKKSGIELRTFGRAGNALNHWTISLALTCTLIQLHHHLFVKIVLQSSLYSAFFLHFSYIYYIFIYIWIKDYRWE